MINFYNEAIKFSLKDKTILKKWLTSTIEKRKKKAGEITFVFCSDAFLLKMNKQYLKHNTYTDIITFDYSNVRQFPLAKGGRGIKSSISKDVTAISGDIFISIDRIKENAAKFSKSFEDELHRVIIHGTLHLLGYKDKTKAAKEEMTKQENVCLRELQKLH